ncbi:unnamed protein product [Nippostrongylus brasiliensis]|uniref:UPF0536 protein C12orf66 (inferred by orthology to a human protein) n=1 Tax=Nippostrongylus brasiliensis TaxID=27835 RepID=A0A0N4XYP9_NIPBR|nr:unnamed protein product [Nippostrongylus brasiliensis]
MESKDASEDESEEVTEASEALEATSSVIEDLELAQASLESPSSSCGHPTTPIFRPADVELIIERYGQLVEKFQFDQAREIIEQYTQSTSRSVMIINERDVSWAALLSSLVLIANCDKNYYLLSFLQPRAFFRKENALKNQYYQISEKLVRACPSAALPGDRPQSSTLADVMAQCRQYVLARVEMINIYTTIASLANDRVILWDSLHARGVRVSEMLKSCHDRSPCSMAHLLSGEIDVLLLLVSAQIHISNCKMFESLLQLKEIRERFDFWVGDSHCLNPVNKSVFYFFRSTEKLPRNRLIHWLIQFYNLLMAKFSLYFTNVLANFCSVDDLKTVHTIDNGFNFISNATQLVKKTDAVCLAIVMDREGCTEDFYGFGYHRLKDRFTPGPPTEPKKGLAALCPAVFRLPSPAEGHKSAQLHNDVFEKYQEYIYAFIQSNLRYPSKSRYIYNAEKDHAKLYLVVVYAGRVCEKDVTMSAFIQQMSTSLRGSRLFLSLKNAAK